MGAHRGADRAGGTHRRGAAGAAVTGAVVDAAGGDRAGGGGLRPGARPPGGGPRGGGRRGGAARALAGRLRPRGGRSRWARLREAVVGDIRDGLATRRALPAIVLTSAIVVIGHALTFLIAARTAGTTAPASRMLPLALLAMMGMALPGVAGWRS